MPFKDYEEHKKYQREYQEKWREVNPEKWKKILAKSDKKRYSTFERKIAMRAFTHRGYCRTKIKVMEMYGTKCAYCGDKRYEALSIDHIHEDGAAHRKTAEYKKYNKGGMWGVLAKIKYSPDRYQVLCHTCNQMKHKYGIRPDGNKCRPLSYWKKHSKLIERKKK